MKLTVEFEGGQGVTMDVPNNLLGSDPDVIASELMGEIRENNPAVAPLEVVNYYFSRLSDDELDVYSDTPGA